MQDFEIDLKDEAPIIEVGLSSVDVETEEATVEPKTEAIEVVPSVGKYLSKVTVEAIKTQHKTYNPAAYTDTYLPDEGYLIDRVTINGVSLSSSNTIVTAGGYEISFPSNAVGIMSAIATTTVKTKNTIVTLSVVNNGLGQKTAYIAYYNGTSVAYATLSCTLSIKSNKTVVTLSSSSPYAFAGTYRILCSTT